MLLESPSKVWRSSLPLIYAYLLTSATTVGDDRVLAAAKQQIRQGFRDQATLTPADPNLGPAIQKAEEIAKILRENVVQGKQDESRVYSKRRRTRMIAFSRISY